MDIRDLKIYIYESCDCGYIDDKSCKKMIDACESVSTKVGSGMISTLQASIESIKELLLEIIRKLMLMMQDVLSKMCWKAQQKNLLCAERKLRSKNFWICI